MSKVLEIFSAYYLLKRWKGNHGEVWDELRVLGVLEKFLREIEFVRHNLWAR